MLTNREIKQDIKETIKNSEKKILFGMTALMFIAPLITIFMPIVYGMVQLGVLAFLYPYLKLLYNNARGKTLELDDVTDYKYFKKFISCTLVVLLHLCSYLLPFVLTLGVTAIGMYLDIIYIMYAGNILTALYFIIFTIKSFKFILYPFFFFHYMENDVSGRTIVDLCIDFMEDEGMKAFGFTLSFLGWFLLSACTLNIAGLFVIPYYVSCMASWFHNHKFGEPLENYYKKLNQRLGNIQYDNAISNPNFSFGFDTTPTSQTYPQMPYNGQVYNQPPYNQPYPPNQPYQGQPPIYPNPQAGYPYQNQNTNPYNQNR